MIRRRFSFSLTIAALILASGAHAQSAQSAPPGAKFSGETTVTVVEVPVQVVLKGEPVRGLKASDFTVYDEGEARPVQFFDVVDLEEGTVESSREASPVEGPAPPVPTAARRHFLLFFDLDFTPVQFIAEAQKAALHLVREELKPTDLVGVAFFHGRSGYSSVIGFTSDRTEVVRALEALGCLVSPDDAEGCDQEAAAGQLRRRGKDPLGLDYEGWNVSVGELGQSVAARRSLADQTLDWSVKGGGGRGGDGVTETIQDMANFAKEDMRQERGTQVSALISALHSLARQTAFIEGSKYLMLFTMGFNSRVYTDEGQSWLATEIEKALEDFRRSGWSIQSIETGAVGAGPDRRFRREALGMLAEETGGELISNSADLASSVGKVLERTSVTYVLGFQTGEVPMDGSFRRIKVELTGNHPDLRKARLIHRTGYYTPRPWSASSGQDWRDRAREMLLSADEQDQIGVQVFAAPMHLEDGGAKVPVLVELSGAGLSGGQGDQGGGASGPKRADIYIYGFDSGGSVVAVSNSQILLDPSKLPSPDGGFKILDEIELPPGELQVRVLVHSLDTGRTALRVVPVTVPRSGDLFGVLLPPTFVQVAGEPWILVRKSADTGKKRAESYPFVFQKAHFVPATVPSVEREGSRPLMVMGYGLPQSEFGLRVRVLDAEGKQVDGVRAVFAGRQEGEAGTPDILAIDLRPGPLAPGTYALEVGLPGVAGWSASARFRVVEPTGS